MSILCLYIKRHKTKTMESVGQLRSFPMPDASWEWVATTIPPSYGGLPAWELRRRNWYIRFQSGRWAKLGPKYKNAWWDNRRAA